MITIISNIAVFLGAVAMMLIAGYPKYRKVGLVIGLLAQPAWFYLTITNRDWGMLAGTVLYTLAFLKGLLPPPVRVRQKIWYAPVILIGFKGVILKTWLRGWFKLIIYRDPANGKCYREWVAGEKHNIFERE